MSKKIRAIQQDKLTHRAKNSSLKTKLNKSF